MALQSLVARILLQLSLVQEISAHRKHRRKRPDDSYTTILFRPEPERERTKNARSNLNSARRQINDKPTRSLQQNVNESWIDYTRHLTNSFLYKVNNIVKMINTLQNNKILEKKPVIFSAIGSILFIGFTAKVSLLKTLEKKNFYLKIIFENVVFELS